MSAPRVVCVDDEPAFADLTATHLQRHADVDAVGFTDPAAALDAVRDGDPACVVSDYEMPGTNGLELLEAVRDCDPELPFVLYTGKGSEQVASEAISRGVTEYLQKSTDPSQYELLANRVENAVERYRTERELARQRTLVERIVDTTPIGLVVHDDTGDVVVANERARGLLEMTESSLHLRAYEGSGWRLCHRDGDVVSTRELPVARVIEDGESLRGERYVLETGGETLDIVLNAEPLTDGTGAVVYVVVAFAHAAAFAGGD